MLASEPPSSRMYTGGGISVRVNGTAIDPAKNPVSDGDRLIGNPDKTKESSEWAQATITWCSGAQRFSDESQPQNSSANTSSSVVDIHGTPPQLVRVIRVKATDNGASQIRITNSGPYLAQPMNFSKDPISVVAIKAEDERSSSGASSAPGSDCERSDSDREADDGTDSGFSPGQCARVSFDALKGVKVTIAPYAADKGRREEGDMHFHMRELDSALDDPKSEEDIPTKIATAHALLSGSGTFSLRNRVRSSIVSLLVQSATNRNYEQEEVGRLVLYTTSMGIVRATFERCRRVRKILDTLMVKCEERDVFMNRGFQQEVRDRMDSPSLQVPQVFVEGRHLGSAEVIEQLNEIGHLRELLRPYKKQSVGGICQQCGGYRYLLCPVCGGSKKSVTHRHHFSEDLVALRCVTCDESGLIRCDLCINGEI